MARRAYGNHREMSPDIKARNVAESILAHQLSLDDPATWTRYGLVGIEQAAQRARITDLVIRWRRP